VSTRALAAKRLAASMSFIETWYATNRVTAVFTPRETKSWNTLGTTRARE
jgi:hypothetical protein